MATKVTVLGHWAIEAFGETSSFLIQSDDVTLLLDAGPGVCRQLYRTGKEMVDVSGVLLSHVHGDHMLGFPYAVFTRAVQTRRLKVSPPALSVVGNSETIAAAKVLLSACYPDRDDFSVDWRSINPSSIVTIGPFSIRAFQVDHTVPTLAFRIETESHVIGYTSDTRPKEGLADFLSEPDLLIVEVFGTRGHFEGIARQQMHLLADEAGCLASDARARRALLFHMHLPYRNVAEREMLLSEFRQNYAGEVIFPEELEEVIL